MRHPNGYGSVYKLSGKRRKPYIVRKTTGWDNAGKQLYQTIGYYETRPQAMLALAEYNKDPYSIDVAKITFAEIFKNWSEEKFKSDKISKSGQTAYIAAYKSSIAIHNVNFVDIKKAHLQSVVDKSGKNYPTLRKIRGLFHQLFNYAIENDIVAKDYSQFIDIGEHDGNSDRTPFTQKEIDTLFESIDRMDFIDTILIQIFTGMRIGELLTIKNKDIDIEKRTIIGGIKTKAGKNRVIPINKKILPFIESRMSENEYLILNHENKQMIYFNYLQEKWHKMMEQLEMKHKPHDCRHTFATLMDNAGANKLCIKRIMGHASKDITDKVYTHKDIDELKKAVDLI